jgi:serine/threonine protein kinase
MSAKPDCRSEHYYVGALIDGRYKLTEFIGAGGMACVYKAIEAGTPHTYAVKFLRSQYHNQDYLIKFFQQEASNMRDLAHPNIVRFYRFVNTQLYSYIVMDFVAGYSLSDIIKRMKEQERLIPLDEAVRVLVQVARALDAIHRDGYVHRDIKPSNVLIQQADGKAFLSDLGITTAAQIEMQGAGTAAYMAPEQAEKGLADQRTDIYAYAVMAFEMLTLRRPYSVEPGLKGNDAEADILHKHREAPIPRITDYRDDLPEALNDIFQWALAKNPDARYDGIMVLAHDIHKVLKPSVGADLQNFSQINHLSGEQAASSVLLNQAQPLQRRTSAQMLAIAGLVIFGLIAVAALLVAGNTDTDSTATRVAAISASSATDTADNHTPTLDSATQATSNIAQSIQRTPTANPIERQPVYPYLDGLNTLALPAFDEQLALMPLPSDPIRYLRVGAVDGFSLTLDAIPSNNTARYGALFRVQDADNYMRLTVDPQRADWRIDEVLNGQTTTLRAGSVLTDAFAPISVTGRRDFFQYEVGGTSGELINDRWLRGSLALWIEGPASNAEPLLLEQLTVGFIGPEAMVAAQVSPTPAIGLGDPYRFLRQDVNALLATNDVITSTVNCPAYIDIYEQLSEHQTNPNSAVRALASEVTRAGELIYARCQAVSPDAPLTFIGGVADYLDWEETLSQLAQQLNTG